MGANEDPVLDEIIESFQEWYRQRSDELSKERRAPQIVRRPGYVDRFARVLRTAYKTDPKIAEKLTKILVLDSTDCDLDLGRESEHFEHFFEQYPDYFSHSNLLSVLGKRPFEDVIDTTGIPSQPLEELRRCYEAISSECFVPFYKIEDDELLGEFDFEEEQLKFGAFLLSRGLSDEMLLMTEYTKDFPHGALVSLQRIIERFDISNAAGRQDCTVAVASFLKVLRKAPVLFCEPEFRPKYDLQSPRGISDLAEICDAPDEMFDFIYTHRFMERGDRPDTIYALLPGLRFVKDGFDADASMIMSLLVKEIKRPFWYHQNFEDFCIALGKVHDKGKVLKHLEDKVLAIKRESPKGQRIQVNESKTIDDYDFQDEVVSAFTAKYLTKVCSIVDEGECRSFEEAEECASLEVPRYSVVQRLGHGVDGTVYKACHDILGDVKIKVFTAPKDKMRKAMEAEGISLEERLKRRIAVFDKVVRDRRFITQFYEVGQCLDPKDGRMTVYTVGDYVDAGALETRDGGRYVLRPDIVDSLDAVPIIYKALMGLEAIHDAGLLLRDIKLSNILVSEDHRIVRIDDIETVAGLGEVKNGFRLTEGSDRYTAPEVMLDTKNASKQSDVYSMAVCLICLLAKDPTLFLGVNTLPIEGYNKRLGEILDIIPKSDMSATDRLTFLTALSYHVEDRFKDAREFRKALINPLGYLRRNAGSSVEDMTEEFWMSMDRQKAEDLRKKHL